MEKNNYKRLYFLYHLLTGKEGIIAGIRYIVSLHIMSLKRTLFAKHSNHCFVACSGMSGCAYFYSFDRL